MSLSSLLRRAHFGPATHNSRPGRSRHATLRVEGLEDRALLTAGALDSTFGTDGKVTTNLGTNNDLINSVALQTVGGQLKADPEASLTSLSRVPLKCPNGTSSTSRTPTGARPWCLVMLVAAVVSSRNTNRAGSRIGNAAPFAMASSTASALRPSPTQRVWLTLRTCRRSSLLTPE